MRALTPILAISLAAGAASIASAGDTNTSAAPAGNADTRYCMKIEAMTGTKIEAVRCWTRAEWEEQGVDLDKEWPREGVRVID